MKRTNLNVLLFMLSFTLIIFSCKKISEIPASSQTPQNNVAAKAGTTTPPASNSTTGSASAADTTPTTLTTTQLVTSGVWKVGYYMEGVENSTSKFTNFTFTFTPDGKVQANEKGSITTGSWYERIAVFYYGIPSYGYGPDGFVMSFGIKRPLSLLSKNLFFTKKTAGSIYLDSVNPAENAHLVLIKI